MRSKTIAMTSTGAALGVGGAYTWFNGFDRAFLAAAAGVSVLAGVCLGFVEMLGKRN